jgi:hypothetical protein
VIGAPPPKIKLGPALVGDSIQGSGAKTCARADAWGKKSRFKPLPKEFRRDGFRPPTDRPRRRCCDVPAKLERLPQSEQLLRGNSHPAAGRISDRRQIRRTRRGLSQIRRLGANSFTFTDKEAAFAKLRGIADSPYSHQR